ncbi:retrovirus-related pol polyprotein from transposon TNT 1-94 [Tanacetum coccineum]
MSEKAKDPEVIAKKISHKPIDYENLNSLTNDFEKRFSPQQELSAEQAFWFHTLNPTIEPSYIPHVIVDVPIELPKVSLVNASLKNLKFHLTQFDSIVKKRTTPSALEEGEWGFGHTKTVFNNEIIPFLKSLKDIFNVFDKDLLNEITEVQSVFDQMEASVQQFSVDKKCLEIAKKEILLENDRLLQKIMSQDVLITVMNSMSLNNNSVNMEMLKCELCEKCLNLDAELSKSKQAYNDLLKNYSQLEKHCISLEVSMQLKQEVFQNDDSYVSQNVVEIPEYFEINDLKARLQDKDNEQILQESFTIVGYPDCYSGNSVDSGMNQIAWIMGYVDYQLGKHYYRKGLLPSLFLWAEAINTACSTTKPVYLNASRYNKTPYELMQDKKSDLSFFYVFGSLCYPTNDNKNLGKFDAKADIGIFVGYTPAKKAFRIYNRRTRIITEIIHVTFDELTAMASEQFSSGPGLQGMTPATSSAGLGSNPISQQPCMPPIRDDWDWLFQPMFDEYFNPLPIDVSPVEEVAALRAEVLAYSLVLTSIDQDAPSTSIPSSKEHEHSQIIS